MKKISVALMIMGSLLLVAGPVSAQEFNYPPGAAQISISDVSVACPGGEITIAGEGFADDVAIDIFFDDVLVTSVVPDQQGSFSVTIEAPAAAAGTHAITAVQDLPPNAAPDVLTASATVACVAAAPGLAVTGGNVTVWMLLVGGLVGIGIIALVAGRRRSRRAA